MRTTTVEVDGKKIEGKSLEFTSSKDEWSIFNLENKGRLRIKVVLTDVIVTEQKTPTGEPLVVTKAGLIVAYDAPETFNAN